MDQLLSVLMFLSITGIGISFYFFWAFILNDTPEQINKKNNNDKRNGRA